MNSNNVMITFPVSLMNSDNYQNMSTMKRTQENMSRLSLKVQYPH